MVFFTLGGDNQTNPNAVHATHKFECVLPFEGFYLGYDCLLDSHIEHNVSELDFNTADEWAEKLTNSLDFKKYHTLIAQAYVAALTDWVNSRVAFMHNFNDAISFEFIEHISPREYNLTSDVITVNVIAKDINAIYEYTTAEKFNTFVQQACSNKDGFISHYPSDAKKWGKFINWTPAQRGILLDCFLHTIAERTGVKDLQGALAAWNLLQDYDCNGQHASDIYDSVTPDFIAYDRKFYDKHFSEMDSAQA